MAFGGLFVSPPTYYNDLTNTLNQDGPRVAMTMFEGTHLPPKWIDPLNQCHRIVVPSPWLIPVFEDNGVYMPIETVPLGISPVFMYPVKREKKKVCTFYTVGDSGGRKAWWVAGFAFIKAFGDSPDHRLIIKARPGSFKFKFNNSNVTLLVGEYTDRAMRDLYLSCDAMAFPSCGEGFGFPPREFAATGGAVATTDWGGTHDDLAQWGYPIPYTMTRAWDRDVTYSELGGRWALADVDKLADWMTWYSEHREEANEKAYASAQTIKRLYNWNRYAEQLIDVWERTEREFYDNRNRHAANTAAD